MFKRNLVLSGVLRKQSRLAKLRADLKRKDMNGSYLLVGAARQKVEEQIDYLELYVRGHV